MEERAEDAEREVVKLKLLRFMQRRVGETMMGVVVGVEEFGAFVELDEIPIDGLIPVRALTDYFEFDRRKRTLTGRARRHKLQLGDHVKVTILSVDLERREMDLKWIP
jgi:ribonuclease R